MAANDTPQASRESNLQCLFAVAPERGRLARWAMRLDELGARGRIFHVKGTLNPSDLLSRRNHPGTADESFALTGAEGRHFK